MSNNQNKKNTEFVAKEFQEVEGGWYDEYGFYYTPNGSFWDDDGYYFNKQGKDKHGGYYDDNFNYIHGESWDEKNECYLSELDADEDFGDYEEEYDGYDENDLAHDLEKAELDAFEKLIKEDANKVAPLEDKKEIKIQEKFEKKEENPVKVENPIPKRNKLNDLFASSSDKTGKINKAAPKK